MAIYKGSPHILVIFDPLPLSTPVHTRPHLADSLPPVRADTNFKYDTEFSAKIPLQISITTRPPIQTPRK